MNKQNAHAWLKKLISIRSEVSTEGENLMVDALYQRLSQLDYFIKNPEHLSFVEAENDPYQRKSLVASMILDHSRPTLIGIGHIDTVSTIDYGKYRDLATESESLKQAFLQDLAQFKPSVQQDLMNSDYLFGRGSLDMKAGVGAWCEVCTLLDQYPHLAKANLILGFVCDEEGNSLGMQSILSKLINIKDTFHLTYLGVIDTDYTAPKTTDSYEYTMYCGTIGKFLLNIAVFGKEAHASDPLEGIDASMILSALISKLCYNQQLSETSLGKVSPVMVPLHIEDSQQAYSVQTAKMAWGYVNVCFYKRPIEQWMNMFEVIAQQVVEELQQKMRLALSAQGSTKEPVPIRVITQKQLSKSKLDLHLPDERMEAYRYVQDSYQSVMNDEALIVLYISPPYYPAFTIDPQHSPLVTYIQSNVQSTHPYTIEPYYPYISDMSFVKGVNQHEIEALKQYMPNDHRIDERMLHMMSALDCEMINIGPLGKDAHQWTERVSLSSFDWLINTLAQCVLEVKDEIFDSNE